MRVLLVADTVGGVRTFVRELAQGLIAAGIELHLALLGPELPSAGLDCASCVARELRLEWMENPWRDVAATGEWVAELCDLHRPDLVHMNTFAPVTCADTPVVLTAHSCVETWWRGVHGHPAPARFARYRRVVRDAFARAQLLVTPTRALLAALASAHGRLPPARVIPNGRSIALLGCVAREPLVVTVGRLWDEAKNAAAVAAAADTIEGSVVAIGPGAPEGVACAGALEEAEVLAWLSRAAVFLEPARYEPFGLSALEAALCGCALVLGDIPSLREVWGNAAVFVSPEEPEALAREVNLLLRDPVLRLRRAVSARSAARPYTPAAMTHGYLDAYATVTGARALV